jgi:hypothetical protein
VADDQVPTGPGGLTTAEWAAIGLPIAGPAQADWTADIMSQTTIDLAARHPMKDKSPWPATR